MRNHASVSTRRRVCVLALRDIPLPIIENVDCLQLARFIYIVYPQSDCRKQCVNCIVANNNRSFPIFLRDSLLWN